MNNTVNISTQLGDTLIKNGETEGFDIEAGKIWIYPTNYSMRDYQYNIIQEALLKNTLVSLPTGLGKTFIAAVVMYNFYRWYPMSKIVFMAPTRPLVKQQIDACYNIMAIPKNVTAELTGTKIQTSRSEIWQEKRVFFVTPQILQNDLDNVSDLARKIKCLVFDEAHKSKGNHAYCEVIRKITIKYKHFRVLALSATPGSSIGDVIEVIRNLLIAHVEVRTDESPDVTPYIFGRVLQVEVVPLDGKLQEIRQKFLQILEVYTRVLVQNKVIHGNCSNLTKGKIFMTMKEYQAKNKRERINNYADIMRNLNICITLYHGYELLIRHGLRSFLNFFQEHSDKPLLRGNTQLINIMMDLEAHLGPKLSTDILPDGSLSEASKDTKFGHPKFYKLRDILLAHFQSTEDKSTRVIVFCEYRESVIEAYALLMQHKPIIRPKIFLGQSAITQRQQINVVKAFIHGDCNTLISTCIGEEGLDVGNVDLIVCFDVSNKSPVRLIQRMGRTGRKRQGRVIVLVTEGREQKTLEECLLQKNYIASNMLQSKELRNELYKNNPRMIPDHITPRCQKMFITVEKSVNLKDMFINMAATNLLQEMKNIDIINTVDSITSPVFHWNKKNPIDISSSSELIKFSKKLEKLRVLQPTAKIGHSTNSEMLVSLMQFAEAKRYNIPITQSNKTLSQRAQISNVKNNFERADGLNNFIQSDIRTMFKKTKSFEATPGSSNTQAEENEKEEVVKQTQPNELINTLHAEISNYLMINFSEKSSCKLCDTFFPCSKISVTNNNDVNLKMNEWIPPDLSVFECVNENNLSKFLNSLNEEDEQEQFNDSEYFENEVNVTMLCEGKKNDQINEKNSKLFLFQPPRSVRKSFKLCNVECPSSVFADDQFSDVRFTQIENEMSNNLSTSTSVMTELKEENKDFSNFFGLDSIEDLFNDSNLKMEMFNISAAVQKTPTSTKRNTHEEGSPILSSLEKVRFLKGKVNKRLFNCETEEDDRNNGNGLIKKKPKLYNLKNDQPTCFYNRKISKDLNINSTNNNISSATPMNDKYYVKELISNVNDICDLSVFGLETNNINQSLDTLCKASKTEDNKPIEAIVKSSKTTPGKKTDNADSDDLFDSSFSPEIKFKSRFNITDTLERCNAPDIKACNFKKITQNESNLDLSSICDLSSFGIGSSENKANDDVECEKEIDITDICDISSFGFNSQEKTNATTQQIDPDESEAKYKVSDHKSNKLSTSKGSIKTKKLFPIINDSFDSIRIPSFVQTQITKEEITKNINSITDKYMALRNDNKENYKNNIELVAQNNAELSVTQVLHFIDQSNSKCISNDSPWIKKKKCPNLSMKSKPPLNIKNEISNFKRKRQTPVKESKKSAKFKFKLGTQYAETNENSDDEFDFGSTRGRSPVLTKVKAKLSTQNSPNNTRITAKCETRRKIKKKLADCPFIENEAELTSDELDCVSETEEQSGDSQDVFEASFIDDKDNATADTSQMHAFYLQSVKSPLARRVFQVFPRPSNNINIFSQEVENIENSYVNNDKHTPPPLLDKGACRHDEIIQFVPSTIKEINPVCLRLSQILKRLSAPKRRELEYKLLSKALQDSFCVNTEDIELSQCNAEMSQLEVAEILLEQCRKKRKKKITRKESNIKRRRIICISSDSD